MTSYADLWTAVWEQADLWSKTPLANTFRIFLPRNASQKSDGVPGVLQELNAGFGSAMAHPLRLGTNIPPLLDSNLSFHRATRDASFARWLAAAQRIDSAHRRTIAWFRSRLPGYPLIKAPQLCFNTPFTTEEWTFELVWTRGERRQGLQYLPHPPDTSSLLGTPPKMHADLVHAAHTVAAALGRTDLWRSFEEEAAGLDDMAKNELADARKRLQKELSSASVDAHEPALALPRAKYREQVTADLVASLSGKARSYSEAFRKVDRLITVAASDVFGQLVAYGDPPVLPVSNLDLRGGEVTTVLFEVPDKFSLAVGCGNVVWLDDPLMTDAVQIGSLSMNWTSTGSGTLKLSALVLDATSDGWQPYRD